MMVEQERVSAAYTQALEAMGICGITRHRLDDLRESGVTQVAECAWALGAALSALDRVTDALGEIEWRGAAAPERGETRNS